MGAETEWRWADPSGQQRLVRTDELRAGLAGGAIAPNAPVWRRGWKEWCPACDVPELTTSALSAANGVVPNIPPPPAGVVAAQHAFEGDSLPDTSKGENIEPPPPPSYVPLPARVSAVPPAPTSSPNMSKKKKQTQSPSPPPPAEKERPDVHTRATSPGPDDSGELKTAVSIKSLSEGEADQAIARASSRPPPAAGRPASPTSTVIGVPKLDLDARPGHEPAPPAPSARPPSVAPKAIGLSSLVRPASTSAPPPPPMKSSRPPPPPASMKGKSVKPPPPKPAAKNEIEELSGSVLLDAPGAPAAAAAEELSGSVLLTDASGQMSPLVEKAEKNDELSGSFLLDVASTGALPAVESTGSLLAAKAFEPPLPAFPAPPSSSTSVEAQAAADAPTGSRSIPLVPPAAGMPAPHAGTLVGAPLGKGMPTLLGGVTPVGPMPPTPAPGSHFPSEPSSIPFNGPLGSVPPPPPNVLKHADPVLAQPPPQRNIANATLVGVAPPPPGTLDDAPPPSPPIRMQMPLPTPVPTPMPEKSSLRLHDFSNYKLGPRAKLVVPALGLLGSIVVLGVIGLIVGAVRGKPGDDTAPTATASEATSAVAPTTTAAATPTATKAPPANGAQAAACTLGGAAHVLAPRAVVASGVEVASVGGKIAIGFATAQREGIVVAVDPESLTATETVRARAHDAIRRLVPVAGEHDLAASASSDRKSDTLVGRRTISASPPFDLGYAQGGLAWAPWRSDHATVLWGVDGDTPIDAVRAAPFDPSNESAGWAVAFRHGASILAGVVTGARAVRGPLVQVNGLGPQVGSPTVAADGQAVLVAWADRASATDPWSVRWMRFTPGDGAADASTFNVPPGGPGADAMSPALAAAGHGRFVLSWAEGPVSGHQVRAQTISPAGTPLGAPLAVSESNVNAGQPQLAVGGDGRGVIAYMGASGKMFQVLATPVTCP